MGDKSHINYLVRLGFLSDSRETSKLTTLFCYSADVPSTFLGSLNMVSVPHGEASQVKLEPCVGWVVYKGRHRC